MGKPFRMLILVLTSPTNSAYAAMEAITRRYYTSEPGVDVLYYTTSPTCADPWELVGDVLTIRAKETYVPGILDKTLTCFKVVAGAYDLARYTYIVRANVSTILDVREFRRRITAMEGPRPAYGSGLVWTLSWLDPKSGITSNKYFGVKFASGTCIIMSQAMFAHILAHEADVDKTYIDDVAIGLVIHVTAPHVEPASIGPVWHATDLGADREALLASIAKDKYLMYRNRSNDKDRHVDARQMALIVDALMARSSAESLSNITRPPFTILTKRPVTCGPVGVESTLTGTRTMALHHESACNENCPFAMLHPWDVQVWCTPDGLLHRDSDQPAVLTYVADADSDAEADADADADREPVSAAPSPSTTPSWLLPAEECEAAWWFQNGQLHREGDKPAMMSRMGTQVWAVYGKIGRPLNPQASAILLARDKTS
jgi:hypothetical protein